jgi:hypothetical protein
MQMAPIRHVGRALIVSAALSLSAVASAEAPVQLCDGDKMEEKQPTAEKSDAKRDAEKSGKKADDKVDPKVDPKESGKTS